MTSLSSLIREQPLAEKFCFVDGRWLTRAQFLDSLEPYRELSSRIREGRIAIRIASPGLLAKALVLLDGSAESLLLLSSETEKEVAQGFFQSARIDAVLEEDGSPSPGLRLRPTGVAPFSVAGETRWIIPTSGTTNIPKLVVHTLSSLADAIRVSPKAREFTWGLMYDLNRFAGLQVFFQTVIGGSPLVLPSRSSDLEDSLKTFASAGVNALSATPTLWRKILMSPQCEGFGFRQITMGGEIADQAVLDAVKRQFPSARVVHIYASTEAGVGFSVADGREGFPASFLEAPPPGVQIDATPAGFLRLRKTATAARYLNTDEKLKDDDGFLNTGDLVRRKGDRFVFLGRANGAINVGGNKVIPEEVESVIRALDFVSDVVVYGKKNPIIGALVAADVVLKDPSSDAASARERIRLSCRNVLEPFKVPAIFSFSKVLDVSGAGKLRRYDHV